MICFYNQTKKKQIKKGRGSCKSVSTRRNFSFLWTRRARNEPAETSHAFTHLFFSWLIIRTFSSVLFFFTVTNVTAGEQGFMRKIKRTATLNRLVNHNYSHSWIFCRCLVKLLYNERCAQPNITQHFFNMLSPAVLYIFGNRIMIILKYLNSCDYIEEDISMRTTEKKTKPKPLTFHVAVFLLK